MTLRGTESCGCPTCRTSRAIELLVSSMEERIEREDERDIKLAYLLDELGAVARSPWSVLVRKRLRKALQACR